MDAIFVIKEELELLKDEGYQVDVLDTINDDICRVKVDENTKEDLIVCLTYMREHTKGYGNIHSIELFGRIEIYKKEISFKQLIKLHNYAQLMTLEFACSKELNGYTLSADVKNKELIELLIR